MAIYKIIFTYVLFRIECLFLDMRVATPFLLADIFLIIDLRCVFYILETYYSRYVRSLRTTLQHGNGDAEVTLNNLSSKWVYFHMSEPKQNQSGYSSCCNIRGNNIFLLQFLSFLPLQA